MEAGQLTALWFLEPLPLKISGTEQKKKGNCSFRLEKDWFASHDALLEVSFPSNPCCLLAYLMVGL